VSSAKKVLTRRTRSRRARGSQLRSPRSHGRVRHTSYVLLSRISPEKKGVYFNERNWIFPRTQFTSALFFFDAPTVHFASATSTVLVLYAFYALFGRGVTVTVCQSVALQVCRDTVIVFTWPFLIREVSFSAFYSPKTRCSVLRSLITRYLSSCSLSLSLVPVTSSLSKMCDPLSLCSHRQPTDGEGRPIVLTQQLYKIDLTPSCFHLDWLSMFSSTHFKQSPCPLWYLYQMCPYTVYLCSSYERASIGLPFP
jgi:hypothetical protein